MWFKKKNENRIEVAKTANIEIAVAKEASEEATKKALEDAKQLKDLLERNHFSVTLYIAMGGQPPRKQTGGK